MSSSRSQDDPYRSLLEAIDSIGPEDPSWPKFDAYRVIEDLGEGGFGRVFRALDLTLERVVALKVLKDRSSSERDAEDRLITEAKALARVRHPNVLVIYGVVEEAGLRALALELIEGEPLSTIVEREGPMTVPEALRVGMTVANALAAVHDAGILHRDVKPSNVIREKTGRIVLADFGLGAFLERDAAASTRQSAAGAPAFMAPEQFRGGPVDARTDVYALGALLHYLLTATLPFPPLSSGVGSGETSGSGRYVELSVSEVPESNDDRSSPAPPEIPVSVAAIVDRALAADPAERFQSASGMGRAIAKELRALTHGAGRRAGAVWAAAIAVLALFVGAAGWSISRGPRAPDSADRRFTVRVMATAGEEHGFHLEPDRDVHVYVLHEDEKGRGYLLHPGAGRPSLLAANASSRRVPLSGGWAPERLVSGGWLILLVAVDPIGPLEDTVLAEATSETGKYGYPRLKPVTVRGLWRVLSEATESGRFDPGDDERTSFAESADVLRPGAARTIVSKGIWAGRVR